MSADHDAAHAHYRRDEDIKELVLRPKKPKSRHQCHDCSAVPRRKRPVIGTPHEPSKTIDIRLEKQFWPGSSKDNLQHIDDDARGGNRNKEERWNSRKGTQRQCKLLQSGRSAAPVQRDKSKA